MLTRIKQMLTRPRLAGSAETAQAAALAERQRAEQVQAALYRLSEAALAAASLDELYHAIHTLIGELMPAKNFYIALYDAAAELLSIQYFVDEHDALPPPSRLGKGLTAYVLQNRQPLLATRADIEQLIQTGQVELIGTLPVDWLGVPLKTQHATVGVMVIQTYDESARLTPANRDVLVFVSTQVALVIARRQAEDALAASERRFRTLIEKSADVIAVVDEQGKLSYQSASGLQVIGYEMDERVGRSAFDLLHPDDAVIARKMFARLLAEPGKSVTTQFRFRHRDGSWVWLETTGTNHLNDPDINGIIVNFRDITARKQANEQIERLNRTLRLISEVNEALVRATDEAELLQRVCQITIDIGGYRLAWVGLAEHDAAKRVRPIASAGYDMGYLESLNVTWADTERGRGPTGTAIRTGQPVAARNMLTDPHFAPWRERAIQHGYASSIALPLISQGQALGAFNLYATEPDAFDTEEVKLLTEMADDLAYGIIALRTRAAREQAEAARRESEERYRAVVEQSADGIYLIDPETKCILEANAAFCALLDYTPEQVKQLTSFDIVMDSRRNIEERIAIFLREKRTSAGERLYRRRDGSTVTVWVTANMISFGGQEVVCTFVRDITERKRAEEALRENERRMSAIVDAAPFGAHLYELKPDGQLIFIGANHSADQILGVDNRQFIGKTIEQAFPALAKTEVPVAYRRVAATGEKYQVDQVDYDEGGMRGAFEVYAFQTGPNRMAAFFRDITERKRAEQEIQRLNLDLRRRAKELAALNLAGQIMASTLDLNTLLERVMEQVRSLLDAEGASVLLCTPTSPAGDAQAEVCSDLVFAAVTGLGAKELIGKRVPATSGIATWVIQEQKPALITDAQSDPRFYGNIDLHSGLTTRSLLAVPLILKGASLGVIEAVNRVTGTFDEQDLAVLEALSSSATIAIENARLYTTEQQRATELARSLERQRELDRLQREFIQNVSHELRTPLALIRGHAEVLKGGWMGDLTTEQKESVGVIARRSQLLTKMVNDIIGVLEVEQRDMVRAPLDLGELVRLSLADSRATAEQAELVLSAEIAADVPKIPADAIALRRALDNLISNAIKFTPAGGRVTVRLTCHEQVVQVQVADTGIGIPSEHLERIFDRFYQVDGSSTRQYGGMGLGLSLTKSIIEAHGGTISVTSEVGAGTTFTIMLPIALQDDKVTR